MARWLLYVCLTVLVLVVAPGGSVLAGAAICGDPPCIGAGVGNLEGWSDGELELDGNTVTDNPNPGLPDDWDRLYANNGTSHQQMWTGVTPDIADRVFRSGSTDLMDFPDLAWDVGSAPPKADIQNSYVALYQGTHVYFGADRLSAAGTTYIGFWLLQKAVVESAGTFTRDSHRTAGDVLVLASFGGGGTVGIAVYRWEGIGVLTPVAIDPNEEFAVVNSGATPSPWPYPLGASSPYTLPAGAFIEGSIDLAGIGGNGCYAYSLTETRASLSLGSELKNFVLSEFPYPPSQVEHTSWGSIKSMYR